MSSAGGHLAASETGEEPGLVLGVEHQRCPSPDRKRKKIGQVRVRRFDESVARWSVCRPVCWTGGNSPRPRNRATTSRTMPWLLWPGPPVTGGLATGNERAASPASGGLSVGIQNPQSACLKIGSVGTTGSIFKAPGSTAAASASRNPPFSHLRTRQGANPQKKARPARPARSAHNDNDRFANKMETQEPEQPKNYAPTNCGHDKYPPRWAVGNIYRFSRAPVKKPSWPAALGLSYI